MIGIVALATVFAAITWRNYVQQNPTSLSGTIEKAGDEIVAAVKFAPGDVSKIPQGALTLLSVPERPEELIRGTVESIDAEGSARIRVLGRPDIEIGSPVRATVDSEVVPDDGAP